MKKTKEILVKLNHSGKFIALMIIVIIVIIVIVFPFLLSFTRLLLAPFINPVKSDSKFCPEYLISMQTEDKTETYCVATPRVILSPVWPLKFPN